MSKSLFDEELDELFRLLGMLEDHLLQIGLPYLEAGENQIFDDADFLEDIKKISASLDWVISGFASEAVMKVWDEVDQWVSELTIQAKPADVLVLAVAVMVIRCTLENRNEPAQPITVSRSRSHPAFYSKIDEVCHISGMPALFDLPEESQLRMLAAALPELNEVSAPVPIDGSQRV